MSLDYSQITLLSFKIVFEKRIYDRLHSKINVTPHFTWSFRTAIFTICKDVSLSLVLNIMTFCIQGLLESTESLYCVSPSLILPAYWVVSFRVRFSQASWYAQALSSRSALADVYSRVPSYPSCEIISAFVFQRVAQLKLILVEIVAYMTFCQLLSLHYQNFCQFLILGL